MWKNTHTKKKKKKKGRDRERERSLRWEKELNNMIKLKEKYTTLMILKIMKNMVLTSSSITWLP